ncbi:MAG: tetratricopeptide repeat protein, partial [Halobacteriota archaeon]
ENVDAWINLGGVYFDRKDYEKAKECYEKAIELDKENVDAWMNLGLVHSKLEDYEKAKECSEKAVELDKENVDAWSGLGGVYFNLKDYEKAKECVEKAVELDKENIDAWLNLGLVHSKLGDYEKAKECSEKAVELDKENVDAWMNLGVTHVKLKNYEIAKNCFEEGIRLDPENEDAIVSQIEVLILKGDYEEAFEKARAHENLFESKKYRILALFFEVLSIGLQNKYDEFRDEIKKLFQHLERTEKPYEVSWDFSDIMPTLEQNIEKEDLAMISLIIYVLQGKADLKDLERKIKGK